MRTERARKRLFSVLRMIVLLLAASGFAALSHAQSTPAEKMDEEDTFVADAFKAARSQPPELGWILKNGELVTEINASQITVLTEKVEPKTAWRSGKISADRVKEFVRKNQADCDQLDLEKQVPLYRYRAVLSAGKEVTRVFVASGAPIAGMKAGFDEMKLSEAQKNAVWSALKAAKGQPRLLYSIRQPGSLFTYTFAAIYQKDKALQRSGIFLLNDQGKILGQNIEEINGEPRCDGCGILEFGDGINAVYLPLNLISMPQLPYPILLEDSSTVEGRAIDLFTFSRNGRPSSYRKYEYVVTCILGEDQY